MLPRQACSTSTLLRSALLTTVSSPMSALYTTFFETVSFSDTDIFSAVTKLKPNLSCGPDGVPSLLYKRLKRSSSHPLAVLFYNQLFSLGAVPHAWKNAIITPVFKKGVAGDVSNCRPISLTCVASKIMERIVAAKIYAHLNSNSLVSCTQHGFINKKLSWCWETRATGCFMLTGSVPISYRFRDKGEFQSKMHLTPASRLILNFIKVIWPVTVIIAVIAIF